MNTSNSYLNPKPHYEILDGLRGVAAIFVVLFHFFEAHLNSPQPINHGYLAVDFFFLLSGFVIGYAYDDRWGKMNLGNFFKRRLIRLHPMVIMGMFLGTVLYFFGSETVFPTMEQTSVWKLFLIFIVCCMLIPLPLSMDIRGWGEMHALNGPAWSLFFEYIANILYALIIRRFTKTMLLILVVISGGLLIYYAVTSPGGNLSGGWKLDATEIQVGFIRLMYPFFGGLLLFRLNLILHIKHAFGICSLLLLIILAFPRLGGSEHLWMNGLYEALCVVFLFPLIVSFGVGGSLTTNKSTRICRFLGAISYPLYITHYPVVYLYWSWVTPRNLTISEVLPMTLLMVLFCILLAYACLKLYDEPVRQWLQKRFLHKSVKE